MVKISRKESQQRIFDKSQEISHYACDHTIKETVKKFGLGSSHEVYLAHYFYGRFEAIPATTLDRFRKAGGYSDVIAKYAFSNMMSGQPKISKNVAKGKLKGKPAEFATRFGKRCKFTLGLSPEGLAKIIWVSPETSAQIHRNIADGISLKSQLQIMAEQCGGKLDKKMVDKFKAEMKSLEE
jgi:hypothetical protein